MDLEFTQIAPRFVNAVWRHETPYVLAMALALGAILYVARPQDRRTLYNTLGFYAASVVGQLAGAFIYALGGATAAAVLTEACVIASGVAVIRMWGQLLFRVVLPVFGVDPPRIVEDLVVMFGYIAWGLVRLRYAGLDLSGIVTASAVITAVLAFSMQDTLGNILGGVALELESSLAIGDWIKVDDVVGRVIDIRWRSTSIETRNWETVVIPNSQLMKAKFTVLGKRRNAPLQWRRWLWFDIDCAVSPERVTDTVRAALVHAEIERVAPQPAPDCLLMGFEGGNARYAVRYWLTELATDDPTDSAVRAHIFTALQRAGMRIAAPEQRLHVTTQDAAHTQELRDKDLARRLAALKHVDLFAGFHEAEVRTIAERLVFAPFSAGDVITRQGAVAHWLYILTAGEADVVLETGAERRTLATLTGGTFFGEMGLMTGEPRTATVIARTHVECYRLDKASFADIVQSRPAIVTDISTVLARRRVELEALQHHLDDERRAHEMSRHHGEILAKIRQFFGLG